MKISITVLILLSTMSFAKTAIKGPITTLPLGLTIDCPTNPTISLQCNTSSPVSCYVWAGSLVPSTWNSTPLLSSGMPPGFMMPPPTSSSPKAVFFLTGGDFKQGASYMAKCFYQYSFNGTVTFEASKAYTPPAGSNCSFVLSGTPNTAGAAGKVVCK